MKIRKMTAWFGTLDGQTLTLGEGLNIISAPNESGKSTWCAFLRTMLYGMDTSQRSRQGKQPDKIRYQPWSGAPMAGRLDLESDDGPVTLQRWTERPGQPMQAFSATVTGTDLPVPLTPAEAGQALTGVSREVFERSAFVKPAELTVSGSLDLERRMASLVSAGEEDQSYGETNDRLQSWLWQRSGLRGAIGQAEENLQALEKDLARQEEAAAELAAAEQALAEAQTRQEQRIRAMEQARAQARRNALSDLAAARARVQQTEERASAARSREAKAVRALEKTSFGAVEPEAARARAEELVRKVRSLSRQAASLPGPVPAAVALALGAAVVLLAFLLSRQSAVRMLALAAFAALAVAVVLWRRHIVRRREELLGKRAALLAEAGICNARDLKDRLQEHGRLWQEHEQAEKALEEAERTLARVRESQKAVEEPVLSGLDFVNGDSAAAAASRAVAQGQQEIEDLREKRAMAEERLRGMEDPLVLRTEIEQGTARLERLREQDRTLQMAIPAMAEADSQPRQKFSPPVARKAAELFSFLTGQPYDEIALDQALTARARRTGDAVSGETDCLSRETQDQLYLSLRLALCLLALPEEQACPLILDDALASFDHKCMERALALLKKLAEKRQILLFTCHSRESAFLAGDPAVTMVEVGHV